MKHKNKIAYFGISLSNRIHFDEEIALLKSILQYHNIDLFIFVDQYQFNKNQEVEMMQSAFEEIDKSDLVIVELSKKAIGVGVEVGYAVAKKKEIIYLKRKGSEYSTTVGGSCQYKITYKNMYDLRKEMIKVLEMINNQKETEKN